MLLNLNKVVLKKIEPSTIYSEIKKFVQTPLYSTSLSRKVQALDLLKKYQTILSAYRFSLIVEKQLINSEDFNKINEIYRAYKNKYNEIKEIIARQQTEEPPAKKARTDSTPQPIEFYLCFLNYAKQQIALGSTTITQDHLDALDRHGKLLSQYLPETIVKNPELRSSIPQKDQLLLNKLWLETNQSFNKAISLPNGNAVDQQARVRLAEIVESMLPPTEAMILLATMIAQDNIKSFLSHTSTSQTDQGISMLAPTTLDNPQNLTQATLQSGIPQPSQGDSFSLNQF